MATPAYDTPPAITAEPRAEDLTWSQLEEVRQQRVDTLGEDSATGSVAPSADALQLFGELSEDLVAALDDSIGEDESGSGHESDTHAAASEPSA